MIAISAVMVGLSSALAALAWAKLPVVVAAGTGVSAAGAYWVAARTAFLPRRTEPNAPPG
jgi:hypothetical protein